MNVYSPAWVVWHQPHDARCAHVAHVDAAAHEPKHSPTLSTVLVHDPVA